MLHVVEVGIGTERLTFAASDGGPKAPVKGWVERVPITRQGVTAMNVIGPGGVKMLAAVANGEASRAAARPRLPWAPNTTEPPNS